MDFLFQERGGSQSYPRYEVVKIARSAGPGVRLNPQDKATIAERSDDLAGGPDGSILNGLQLFGYNKKFSFIDIIYADFI